MASEVEYTATALRQLRKLDRPIARRIVDYLDEVAQLDDPRSRGKALVGDRAGIWRYRVGDYRVLCELPDIAGTGSRRHSRSVSLLPNDRITTPEDNALRH